ncbi:MAG TPA: DUF4260 domain-containing protein [Bryobacteraceae bacterium]|nr:DUF4260 domain-containing protein [Bryobacteraceae bacterium]
MPRLLLHAEGFAVLSVSLAAYHQLNGSWLWFFLLFLWPDLFMLGYLANVRLGAVSYNLAHTEVFPVMLGAAAVFEHWERTLLFCLIWLAHIAFDRMLGYGLKYPTFFKDTHLQRVG